MSQILGFKLDIRLFRAKFDRFWPHNGEYKFLTHWNLFFIGQQ